MIRFDFVKGRHIYSYFASDVKILINELVDDAESPNVTFDLMDVFKLVRELANRDRPIAEGNPTDYIPDLYIKDKK